MRVAHTDALDISHRITVATWIKGDEFQNFDGLVTKGTTNSPYALQVMADGRLRFDVNYQNGGERSEYLSAGALQTGQWHHAAVTYDGQAVRFYIDGQLDANVIYANLQFDTNTEDLVLGADLPGGDEYFDGTMDDTRLYNRALSAVEVADLANGDRSIFEYNGSSYLLTSDKMTWSEAQAEAERLGGNLVTVNDGAEDAWLRRTFGWSEQLWLGITDQAQEGIWKWASGEEVTFTNWSPGQHFGVLNYQNGKWDDSYEDGIYVRPDAEWVWLDGLRGIIEITPPAESADDELFGGLGNDTLLGGKGNDILNGTDAIAAGYLVEPIFSS